MQTNGFGKGLAARRWVQVKCQFDFHGDDCARRDDKLAERQKEKKEKLEILSKFCSSDGLWNLKGPDQAVLTGHASSAQGCVRGEQKFSLLHLGARG